MTEAHQEQAAGTPEPLDRDTVQEMLVNRQFHSLRRVLAQSDHVQVSDLMGELGEQERAIIFRLLPKGLAVMVFEELEPPEQSELLTALGEERTLELLGALSPDAKHGFTLLPRRWVVERSFGWATRFRRLAKDYERLPETLVGLHFIAFVCLMLRQATPLLIGSP